VIVMVTAVGPVPVPIIVVIVVIVVVATPGHVHLAMLVVPMPVAIEMPAVGVTMHMAMMMAVPVVPIDIFILRQLHDPGFDLSGWLERCCFGCGRGKCQGKTGARHRQCLCVWHEYSPLEDVRFTSVHARWVGKSGLITRQAAPVIDTCAQVKPA
jgi:hypothetical protein